MKAQRKKLKGYSDLWQTIMVHPNGDFSPCFPGEAVIGNIDRDSIDILDKKLSYFNINANCDNFNSCSRCAEINGIVMEG